MKNMERSTYLQILHPAASLKGVWLPRNGKKIRESEGKIKEVGMLKGSSLKKNFINEGDPFTVLGLGAFIAKSPLQITKIT